MMKKLKFIIKLLITFILIWYVFSQIDKDKFLITIKNANIFWLFLAFFSFNVSKLISSIRLNYFFKDLGLNLSEKNNLYLYYIGMFYNLFLPSGIGGDGYKIYLLNKLYKIKVTKLLSAILIDRVSGMVALGFLCSFLFLSSSLLMLNEYFFSLGLFFLIIIYPTYFYFHKKLFKSFIYSLKETTILALIVQIFQLICAVFILYSIRVNDLIDFLTIFLISSVVAVLPLTIGGIGAREFTFLYALALIEKEPNLGIAFSIIFFIITAFSSLIGGVFVFTAKEIKI